VVEVRGWGGGRRGGEGGAGVRAGGPVGPSMGMLTRGPALNPEFGAALGRGTGEQTGTDRAVGNMPMPGTAGAQPGDPHAGHGGKGPMAPGVPQEMFDRVIYPPEGPQRPYAKNETPRVRPGGGQGSHAPITPAPP